MGRQGGHPARPAAPDLCGQAARGWPHPAGLQHPEGVYPSPSASPSWWNADLCEDTDWQDHHARGGGHRHHRGCQGQDPRQGGHPPRPAAPHLRWQAARGWPHSPGLQHPEGVHSPPCAPSSWRSKKRKKKTYTKPKKIKHKKKKVKLHVLKYYQVDASDKVTRMRRECPHADCGAGVFMAQHFDRQYCGKCHLTYMFKNEGDE